MPSPFPGMDPYLEHHWGDVHHRLITYASDRLNELLPQNLKARVEERVLVESPEEMVRPIVPDLRIFERSRRKRKLRSKRHHSNKSRKNPRRKRRNPLRTCNPKTKAMPKIKKKSTSI